MAQKFWRISIYGIWILNVAVVLIPTIICTKGFTTYDSTFFDEDYLRLYGGAWDAVQHITFTIPLLLIIVFYFTQLYLIKSCCGMEEAQNGTGVAKYKKKSMERMIHMVAIGTLVCYVPYATWIQYNIYMIGQKRTCEVLDNTVKVSRLPVID